jgi:hypothetical protein
LVKIPSLGKNLAKVQGGIYAGLMQRAQLQVQLALAIKLDKDIAKLRDKYDGKDIAELETKVDDLFARKEALIGISDAIKDSLDQFNEVRESLNQLHTLSGSASSFDVEIDTLNKIAGRALLNPNNLIGDTGKSYSQFERVDTGTNTTTTVKRSFLGTNYFITLDDGTVMRPDLEGQTLASIPFADLDVVSLNGSDIQFTDGTTTYDGTLTRTGGGIMSSWLYNDFATQTDIDNAKTDVRAAMRRVDLTEQAFRRSLLVIDDGVESYEEDIDDASEAVKTTAQENLDALQAEEKALQTKFDLTLSQLALTSKISTDFIASLFLAPDPFEKRDVFDIINDGVA